MADKIDCDSSQWHDDKDGTRQCYCGVWQTRKQYLEHLKDGTHNNRMGKVPA